ncbi:hypothetical protein GCM10010503_52590 [Streptomyces lucensis JCM 4490]|uniref:Uncharacterized protein n=1 Tax=Streptomyces lucensis JCM 4490 TaxID=1306176 RepID=A0A918JAQ7_9ACTN|nr:hypothetical protein GCM10010503_52590 [Streptomyces lucensis JCM 4490]
MYGRVSGGLPHDNPYWRGRHPREAAPEKQSLRRCARQAALTPAPPTGGTDPFGPGARADPPLRDPCGEGLLP